MKLSKNWKIAIVVYLCICVACIFTSEYSISYLIKYPFELGWIRVILLSPMFLFCLFITIALALAVVIFPILLIVKLFKVSANKKRKKQKAKEVTIKKI